MPNRDHDDTPYNRNEGRFEGSRDDRNSYQREGGYRSSRDWDRRDDARARGYAEGYNPARDDNDYRGGSRFDQRGWDDDARFRERLRGNDWERDDDFAAGPQQSRGAWGRGRQGSFGYPHAAPFPQSFGYQGSYGQSGQGNFGQGSYGQSGQGNFGQGSYGQGNFGQGGYGQGNFGQGNFGQGSRDNFGHFGTRSAFSGQPEYGGHDWNRDYTRDWDRDYRGDDRRGNARSQDEGDFGDQLRHAGRQVIGKVKRAFRGPKGYKRSDERIREDVNDRLAHQDEFDPSEIEVRVENGDVTLTGSVRNRHEKFRAEEIADDVGGVNDVHNQLRIGSAQAQQSTSTSATSTTGTSTPIARNGRA